MTFTATFIFVGRFLLGLMFIIAGIRNFARLEERFAFKTNYGFVLPRPAIVLGFAVQLIGGISVAFGLLPAWGALALIAFIVPATAFYHNALMFSGKEREPHIYFVTVNMALIGAFLLVIALS
ncbi:MAG TPA: DoxX family membrane protein [Devosia sp.]|nr:DoxX family membrane protein [Devosia sp.]